MENIKEAIDLIKSGKVKFQVQVTDFIGKDPKVDKLMSGEYTIPAFLEAITDSDPYTLIDMSEEMYIVQNKASRPPTFARLKSSAMKNVWDHLPAIRQVFPEMNEFLDKVEQDIKDAKCTGCAKNNKAFQVFQEMCHYDCSARDLEPIKELTGRVFVRELKANPPVPRQPAPTSPAKPATPPPVAAVLPGAPVTISTGKAPRPSCFNCFLKHLSQSIVLLGESKLGYEEHRWLAIGHLAEASEEILEYPELANIIRTERLNLMNDPEYTPNLMPYITMALQMQRGLAVSQAPGK